MIRQNAAEALLARAGWLVDAATDEDRVSRASIAVAGPLVSWCATRHRAEEAIARHFGLSLPGHDPVDGLGTAKPQIVQIIRSLL